MVFPQTPNLGQFGATGATSHGFQTEEWWQRPPLDSVGLGGVEGAVLRLGVSIGKAKSTPVPIEVIHLGIVE